MTEAKARRRRHHARDEQEPSAFAAILAALLDRIPGARAAALVDADGETVDYTGAIDPFELRLTAAHWRIVLHALARSRSFVSPRSLAIRCQKQSYVAWGLPEDYAIVVLLGRRAGMGAPTRAFFACERALCAEAGWAARSDLGHWYPVAVECDRKKRPLHLHVLGAIVGLGARERGYRVRLTSGAEISLIREPGGAWYADEKVDLGHAPSSKTPRKSRRAEARPRPKKKR